MSVAEGDHGSSQRFILVRKAAARPDLLDAAFNNVGEWLGRPYCGDEETCEGIKKEVRLALAPCPAVPG